MGLKQFYHLIINSKILLLLLYCLLLGLGKNISAQAPALRKYQTEDGLPSSNVYHCFQDSKGFIWACTDKGVARFDGYEFTVITTIDGLPSNDVFGMVEDKAGRIWLNTFNQAVYLQNGKVNCIEYQDFVGKIVFHQIDPYGNHLIDAGNKLYQWRESGLITPLAGNYLARLGSYYLLPDAVQALDHLPEPSMVDSSIYFDGEFFHDRDNHFNRKTTISNALLPQMGVLAFDKKIFIAEPRELSIIQGDEKIAVDMESIFGPQSWLTGAKKISNALFYLLSNNGIKVFDEKLIEQSKFDFLNELEVNSLTFDDAANLWISTRRGLFFLGDAASNSKTILPGKFEDDNCITALNYSDGKLWMGNDDGVLYLWEHNKITERIIPSLSGDKIRTIVEKDGRLHLGGKRLNIIPAATFAHSTPNSNGNLLSVPEIGKVIAGVNAVKDLSFTKNGNLLIAKAHSASVMYAEDDNMQLSETRSYAIVEDMDKKIWIGHKDGLEVYNQEVLINMRSKNPRFKYGIKHLAVDKNNFLWIATDGNGVFCYRDSLLIYLPELRNKIVNKVHVTSENLICCAFDQGMICYTIESYHPFKYHRKKISTANGLCANEVTDITSSDKEIFVATTNGVTIFQKDKIEHPLESPKLFFQSVKINGQAYPIKNNYDLQYDSNNIDISYRCLSYKSDQAISYQYKMEGIDQQWQLTQNLVKEYTTLPAGQYTFRLTAKDVDDMMTAASEIIFTIHPPFWKTLWFGFLAGLLIIGSVIQFIRWRIRLIKVQSEKENLIHQQIAESELQALKSQINPHFVFNALNAIQDFIFQNDPLIANQYLSKFSRLMRLFLESSRERFIPIKDELQILTIYTELEQLRFKDKFDYEIIIDEKFIQSNLEIPSMFLQPFVENAINHGLAYRSSKGFLTISFLQITSGLQCTIVDNGIGRNKAAALKSKSTQGYKSRGLQLVEERRKTLSFLEHIEIEINIVDLKNNADLAIGTKVEIIMPLPVE